MFAVCHGNALYGETIVPAGIQGYIQDISIASNSSCAIVDNAIACWGNFPEPSTLSCTPSSLFMWTSNTVYAAALCSSSSSMFTWSLLNSTPTLVQSVTYATSTPNSLCYIQTNSIVCNGVATGVDPLYVKKMYGNSHTGCAILLNDTQHCWGDVATVTLPIQGLATNSSSLCVKYEQGWKCSQGIWSINGFTKEEYISARDIQLTESVTCAIVKDGYSWCQGSFANENAVSLFNTEDTSNSEKLVLSSTHVCSLIASKSSFWGWVIFSAFLFFLLIASYVGILHYKHQIKLSHYSL